MLPQIFKHVALFGKRQHNGDEKGIKGKTPNIRDFCFCEGIGCAYQSGRQQCRFDKTVNYLKLKKTENIKKKYRQLEL